MELQEHREPMSHWRPEGITGQNLEIEKDAGNKSMDEDVQSWLLVSAVDWTNFSGCKSIQYIKLGRAPNTQTEENWALADAKRRADRNFSTDLEYLMKQTTNDEILLKHGCA